MEKIDSSFQEWAYVELMGHNKIAGLVTEHKFGNQSMIRVDVPAVGDTPKFSKIFNVSSVYGITPVTEKTAIDLALKLKAKPLDVWDMQQIFEVKMKALVDSGEMIKPQLAEKSYDDIGDFDV